jgi:hypothetical protein
MLPAHTGFSPPPGEMSRSERGGFLIRRSRKEKNFSFSQKIFRFFLFSGPGEF